MNGLRISIETGWGQHIICMCHQLNLIYNNKRMTKLYMGSIIIDWEKMDEVVRNFIIQNRLTFKEFLALIGKDKKTPLPNATYYAWRNRNRIRANYIKRMEELWIDVNLFIKQK